MSLISIFTIFFIVSSSVIEIDAIFETTFTHRYGQRLLQDHSDDCPFKCQCPEINTGNICVCDSMFDDESYHIDAPYAALLIQLACYPKEDDNEEFPDEDDDPRIVNMASVDMKPIQRKPEIYITGYESILQTLKKFPNDVSIRYLLYYKDRNDNEAPPLKLVFGRIDDLILKNRDEGLDKLIFLIPGWTSEFGKMVTAFKDAILNNDPVAGVVLVDWMFGNQFYLDEYDGVYEDAAANTLYVGFHLASHLIEIRKSAAFEDSSIHLIGFDMGIYVAKYASMKYADIILDEKVRDVKKKIDRITALDPPMHIFGDDPLSLFDATYVDVYHSNPMIDVSKDAKQNIIENIKQRRYGDKRALGHADFYININEDGVASHPQCMSASDERPLAFDCASNMASQVYLDSIMKVDRSPFQISASEGASRDGVFGFYSDAQSSSGVYQIKYENEICSIKDSKVTSLPPMIDPKELMSVLGSKVSLKDGRDYKTFPLEGDNLIQMEKSEEEYSPECGKFDAEGRVFDGLTPRSPRHLPFAVCIQIKAPIGFKAYDYILKDGNLYERPISMKFSSNFDRRLNALDLIRKGYVFSFDQNFQTQCSGSVIFSGFVVTSAHCVEILNGTPLKLVFGTLNCEKKDAEVVVIDAERETPGEERNIFIPQKYADSWDKFHDKWINDMKEMEDMDTDRGSRYGILSVEETKNPISRDAKRFIDFSKDQILGLDASNNNVGCNLVPYLDHDIDYVKSDSTVPFDSASDIALIRFPDYYLDDDTDVQQICFRTPINMEAILNQNLYVAGFGSKGKESIDDSARADDLNFLPMKTPQMLDKIKDQTDNVMFMTPSLGFKEESDDYFYVINVEKDARGNFITSATCPGDSGGPVFIYAKTASDMYAYQVALVTGYKQPQIASGSVNILRDGNVADLKLCAKFAFYNVYTRKYMFVPQIMTRLSKHFKWISDIIDDPDEYKLS